MLARNAGLKSRFTHTLEFPDWEVNDCVKCFLEKANMKGFDIADGGADILQKGFGELQALDGFGNARDVDAVWKATCRFRADRVIASDENDLIKDLVEVNSNFQRLKRLLEERLGRERTRWHPWIGIDG